MPIIESTNILFVPFKIEKDKEKKRIFLFALHFSSILLTKKRFFLIKFEQTLIVSPSVHDLLINGFFGGTWGQLIIVQSNWR